MEEILAKAAGLSLMGFDVDGVLTDGTLYYTAQGDAMKSFSTLDGHGLKLLQQVGIEVIIISGRASPALELRAANLGIDGLYMGVEDKRAVMADILRQRGMGFSAAGYMGDDIVDLPLLLACGFSATAADSHPDVVSRVDFTTQRTGGRGAVREVCELILRAQGKWDSILATYLA